MTENPFSEYEKVDELEIKINGEIESTEVTMRLDPLLGKHSLHTSVISKVRANKPTNDDDVECHSIGPEECIFCYPKVLEVTPEPRIVHDLIMEDGNPVLTFPNRYPFAPKHLISVFTTHKVGLGELVKDDMRNYFESGYQISVRFREEGIAGILDGMNWGTRFSAASQEHPHAQRVGLDRNARTVMNLESSVIGHRSFDISGDPFEDFMEKVRHSPYFIFENDFVLILASFAPMFSDQVDVISKKHNGEVYRTILDIQDSEVRRYMAESLTGVFNALRDKRNVTDLNVQIHQSMFDQSGYYRLHWHICPRNSSGGKVGFSEMNNLYPVTVFPEETAKALYKHYYHPT